MSLSKALIPYNTCPSAKRPQVHLPTPEDNSLKMTSMPCHWEPALLSAATPFQGEDDAGMAELEFSPSKRGIGPTGFKDFKGATSPDKADFKGGAQAKFWWRAHEKRGETLAGEKELVHRSVKGRSLVWFLPLGSSSLWQCELDKAHREDSQLKALLKKLANEGYSGYSFRAVHPILPFVCL
ncbi:hypothetical protein EI94DRAFT_1750805 [Lactarius quietus]|nr:hypothetical protein EI94DRAFT_1750805 [Lactarius quietus]